MNGVVDRFRARWLLRVGPANDLQVDSRQELVSFDIVTVGLNRFLGGVDSFSQAIVSEIAFGHLRKDLGVVRIQLERLFVFVDGLARLALVVEKSRFRKVVIGFET